jgi:hypothetical protein
MGTTFIATSITALTFSLNASVLMTNPIPVSGSGNILVAEDTQIVDMDFAGSNAQGVGVVVDVSMQDCGFGLGSFSSCGLEGGLLGLDIPPSPPFQYGGGSLNVFSSTTNSPLVTFEDPVEGPAGPPPPNQPTEAIIPLEAAFIFGAPVESCPNGAAPPLCGHPTNGACGSGESDCVITNTFQVVPTPEPNARLLLALGVLCLLIKVRVVPPHRETVRRPGTIWEHRRAENGLIYPKLS